VAKDMTKAMLNGNDKVDEKVYEEKKDDVDDDDKVVRLYHKLAPSLYECFYNTLTICSTFNVDAIIDMMLK